MRHLSARSMLTFGACLALPAQAQKAAQEMTSQKPNIVLIYADDIGYGDLSCDALISQIDLLGTMAGLTGVELEEKKLSDSKDQLSAWLGLDSQGREYVVGAGTSLMIRTKDWKYIEPNNGRRYNRLTNTEMGNSPEDQLYHLRYDRGEYDNMAEKNQLKVRFFRQILEEEKSKGIGMDL